MTAPSEAQSLRDAVARAEKAEAERDAAREIAGMAWTAPDVDAWGRHAEEKGAVGVRDRMNRLFRRACLAEEDARQLRNEAERTGHDHQAIADATLTARIADLEAANSEDVVRAMRTFEQWGGPLRYREEQKWHTRDIIAMRKVLEEFAARSALSNKDAGHE